MYLIPLYLSKHLILFFRLDEQHQTTRSAVPGRFLVDFVKERVFASDSGPADFHPQILARQELFRILHTVLEALVKVWGQPRTATAINSVANKVSQSNDSCLVII